MPLGVWGKLFMQDVRISLVCGSPLLSDGIISALSSRRNYKVLSKLSDASVSPDHFGGKQFDVSILATSDPTQTINSLRKLHQPARNTKIIVFSTETRIEHIVEALDAGAIGYLTNGCTPEELLECVQTVLDGDTFVSPCIATKLIASLRTAALRKATAQKLRLTLREEQIVALLRKGKTNREIASALRLSEKTIKHYMTVLMDKLAARSRLEVVLTLKEFDPATTVSIPQTFN